MNAAKVLEDLKRRFPNEPEYHQAVEEVLSTIEEEYNKHPEFDKANLIERLCIPDRVYQFRVTWVDDKGNVQTNMGYRVQHNNAIGPYKGGVRFHASVNLSILKFLAFEQTFKNSLTTLPMGGGKGGSDFSPRGKPSVPVTGFRESAWVAGSHKLWKSGVDVFLSKDGETFKELKAADYIPVGATLNVDGIRCRIDAVDFATDEVRLTNIEDKNRPIRFSESIQYVRSYVEDAGTAIYDTIPKKPAARESIRDKLKSAQKAQPPHTPKPQKSKGKDMVL